MITARSIPHDFPIQPRADATRPTRLKTGRSALRLRGTGKLGIRELGVVDPDREGLLQLRVARAQIALEARLDVGADPRLELDRRGRMAIPDPHPHEAPREGDPPRRLTNRERRSPGRGSEHQ